MSWIFFLALGITALFYWCLFFEQSLCLRLELGHSNNYNHGCSECLLCRQAIICPSKGSNGFHTSAICALHSQ